MAAKFILGFAVGLCALFVPSLFNEGGSSEASHPISPRYRVADIHPVLGFSAKYSECTTDPPIQLAWNYGAEIWEDYLLGGASFSVSSTDCNGASNIRVVSIWEYGSLSCNSGDIACWRVPSYTTHTDAGGSHRHATREWVIYDAQKYPPYNTAWRNRISAHEWGHVMSLEDHVETDCDFSTIMQRALPSSPPPPPPTCDRPTFDDVCGAWTAYNYDRDTDGDGTDDGCDIDADEDGCLNEEELGPDVDQGGDRNPLYFWDFFDPNQDGFINNDDIDLWSEHYGHGANQDAVDNLLDRYIPNSAKPWRTAESNNGIDNTDYISLLASLGDVCASI